jgi:rhodanese-related sulfurtransferase
MIFKPIWMTVRQKLSVILILTGTLLAFLPLRNTRSLNVRPEVLLTQVFRDNSVLTVDQVARLLASDDSTIQIIDVRSPDDFGKFSLPGAINIPFEELIGRDPETFLARGEMKNIFYSNGSTESAYAIVLAGGLGYNNCTLMKGGMNDWIKTVMNSRFTGLTITARENALFETRSRAARLFTEFNSLPDSLKMRYLSSKRFDPKKLDGGC